MQLCYVMSVSLWCSYATGVMDHADSPGLQVPDLTNFNFPSAIRVLDQFGPEAAVSEANLRYEEILMLREKINGRKAVTV